MQSTTGMQIQDRIILGEFGGERRERTAGHTGAVLVSGGLALR